MNRRQVLRTAIALSAAQSIPAGAGTQGAKSAGYRYPDEAHPHKRTFMQWPVSRAVYPSRRMVTDLQQTIAQIANTIAEFEPVVMLMDKAHASDAGRMLSETVEIWDIPTEDLWARDSGPAFVIDGQGGLAITHFNFNGWGGKQTHRHDGKIAQRVASRMGLHLFDVGLVGEPGGAEFDGDGTLLVHQSSWVNRNRNPGSKAEVEALLKETYGADKVIWAPGLAGQDITDFHIDALARFTEPGTVLIQIGDTMDRNDVWSTASFATYDTLRSVRDAHGRTLRLVTLPDPTDIRVTQDDFVASYVNYYVCNGAVIASEFGDTDADARAQSVLSDLYPDREVVMLNTDALGRMGGGIHCATHQQPRV
ncbi:MAG: agmatine deiminase family protein [Pseudomonadota bacterium]